MAKKNYLQIIFLFIAVFFGDVNFCLGQSRKSKLLERYLPAATKIAAPAIGSEIERMKKKREIEKELAKSLDKKIEDRLAKERERATVAAKGKLTETATPEDIKAEIETDVVFLKWQRRKDWLKKIQDEEVKTSDKEDVDKAYPMKGFEDFGKLSESRATLEKEVDEELKAEIEGGGLAGQVISKKGGLAGAAITLAAPSLATGLMFASTQTEAFADEDEEGMVLEDALRDADAPQGDREEEVEEEEVVEGEVVDDREEEVGEEIEPEVEKEVKKEIKKKVVVKKEPEKEIVEEVTKGAAGVVAGFLKTAAMATADPGTKAKMQAEERREAEAEAEKKKAEEKKSKAKKEKKAKEKKEEKAKEKKKVEKKKIEKEKKIKEETLRQAQGERAKKEVLKVITLPKGMKLTPKQSKDFLTAIADHAKKTLKHAGALFAQDAKQKTFTTVSGEVVSVVGQNFSKKYINKYNSELALYKKARDEYKALLKKKKAGEEIDEDKLKLDKRYYLDIKIRARNAFLEKRDAINEYALYYPVNEKGSAWNIIKEGVKIIEEHTPEKFEKIDLLKIFKYLKSLGITQRDILPKKKISEGMEGEDIEKELFADIDSEFVDKPTQFKKEIKDRKPVGIDFWGELERKEVTAVPVA